MSAHEEMGKNRWSKVEEKLGMKKREEVEESGAKREKRERPKSGVKWKNPGEEERRKRGKKMEQMQREASKGDLPSHLHYGHKKLLNKEPLLSAYRKRDTFHV